MGCCDVRVPRAQCEQEEVVRGCRMGCCGVRVPRAQCKQEHQGALRWVCRARYPGCGGGQGFLKGDERVHQSERCAPTSATARIPRDGQVRTWPAQATVSTVFPVGNDRGHGKHTVRTGRIRIWPTLTLTLTLTLNHAAVHRLEP